MTQRYLCILIITLGSLGIQAQHKSYDFDSLLNHNPLFEPLLRSVADTFRLFNHETPLEFDVFTDFKLLQKNRFKDEYQEAKIQHHISDTLTITRQVRIKPRGAFRLKECRFPPLRVNVKRTQEVFELLDQLDKLKMVIPCSSTDRHQTYIFNEYLAYKLYNIVTDYSFGVRLLKVNYQNTSGKMQVGSAYTFVIESQKSLARRLMAIPIKNDKVSAKSCSESYAAVMYLFQYLIGNTDWSVAGLHNVKLIKTEDPTIPLPIPVPYDFDYSGLVDASYAIPGDHVDIPSVRFRKYLGYCVDESTLNQAVALFLEKEQEVISYVEQFPWLQGRDKERSLSYIREFYQELKDPKLLNRKIASACKH